MQIVLAVLQVRVLLERRTANETLVRLVDSVDLLKSFSRAPCFVNTEAVSVVRRIRAAWSPSTFMLKKGWFVPSVSSKRFRDLF